MNVIRLPPDPPEHVRKLMATLGYRIVEDPSLERPWWHWDADDGRRRPRKGRETPPRRP